MRILLVDDDDMVRCVLQEALSIQSMEVVAATCVRDALQKIVTQDFDVLITDLHMPEPSDGYTVVTAMRHFQPGVYTIILSGFPDVEESLHAIAMEVDEVLSKPVGVRDLLTLIQSKGTERKHAVRSAKEAVATILDRNSELIVQRWLWRVEMAGAPAAIPLFTEGRVNFIRWILKNIVIRLRNARDVEAPTVCSNAAEELGKLRDAGGYTAPLIVRELRILQLSIFETIQRNLSCVDFSLVLCDIMLVADEMIQTVESFLAADDQRRC